MSEHEHTKTDGLGEMVGGLAAVAANPPPADWRAAPRNERMAAHKIECNACPVLCQISDGKVGACDRYANQAGVLVRVDPVLLVRQRVHAAQGDGAPGDPADAGLVPFLPAGTAPPALADDAPALFVTAVGASTTYPDYKPAPFIVASQAQGVDMVTVVTEGIFSYCSLKLKIDTDRWLGPEQANVRCKGEVVGHVTHGRIRLADAVSLGGVHHLTGGSKKEGRVTVDMMAALGNQQAVDLQHRRRRPGAGAGRRGAGRQRRARAAHARGLRLGHHRHLCAAVCRPGRRGGGGRRPHHRRADRAPGRALPEHARARA